MSVVELFLKTNFGNFHRVAEANKVVKAIQSGKTVSLSEILQEYLDAFNLLKKCTFLVISESSSKLEQRNNKTALNYILVLTK